MNNYLQLDNEDISVYFSYAPESDESLKIVDRLITLFEEKRIPVIRDKRDERYKRFLSRFSQSLGYGDYIILIVGEKFLKSEDCVSELVKISKNHRYQELIFPIILEDAKIQKPIDRLTYIHYWEREIKELEDTMKRVDLAYLNGITDELDNYKEIRQKISGFMNNLKSLAADFDNNFQIQFNAIERQIEKDKKKSPILTEKELALLEERKKYKYYADRIDQSKKFQYHFYKKDNKVQVYFIHGKKNQSPSGLYKRICLERSRFNKDDIFCFPEPITLESLKYKEYCKIDLLVKLFEKFGFDLGDIDKDKRNILGLSELPPLKIKKYVFVGVTIGYDEWEKCVPELLDDLFSTILSEKKLPRGAPTFIFIFLLNYPGKKALPKHSSESEGLFELNTCSAWLPRLDPVLKADIKNWFEEYMPECKKEKQYIGTYFKGNRFKMIEVEKHLEKIIKDYYQRNKENGQNDYIEHETFRDSSNKLSTRSD